MIDLSKLPAPKIVEELSFEEILAAMRADFEGRCPGWTAAALESDPANKILEVAAYRELLLRQRINEAARACMLAFASGSDLDHLSAFYAVSRLEGARATFPATLTLSASLPQDITIPQGYTVVDTTGNTAELRNDVVLRAQQLSASGVFEVTAPDGDAANGLTSEWTAITPLPWVVRITQETAASGGSNTEADTSLRARTQLSPESWSTAGPAGAYKYWALSADERIADIHVSSPTPGIVQIVVLADSETGEADAAMLERITEILNDEEKRPLTDIVNVLSATPQPYSIGVHLTIEAGVSSDPVLVEAKNSLERLTVEKHKIRAEIPLSAIIAAAHVEGVRKVMVSAPTEDILCAATEAPYCTGIAITWSIVSD